MAKPALFAGCSCSPMFCSYSEADTRLALWENKQLMVQGREIHPAQQPEKFTAKAEELSHSSKVLSELGRLDEAFAASQEAAELYQRVLGISILDETTDTDPRCTCESMEHRLVKGYHQVYV
ncbi:unnamed protein product [Rhizoctonia solani]|uniref:Uncharacterized protein n=1 Tax=Rhizoctonia solani TaxID=456999 RepID=A0A8H2WXI6_9AGAM|nr:unnamed protein product [Rhizoctonia solani]